jgi:glycosyltransferase involved in cell wall biosynthesis
MSAAQRTGRPQQHRAVRVAHVIGTLNRGGAETTSLDICRLVPAEEVEQTFITLGGREGQLADQFRAAGARVQQCPLTPVHSMAPRLWRCLRSVRPDVVVSHVNLASAVILLLARAAGVPVRVARIWSEGDGRRDTLARRARRALLRRLLGHAATDVLGVTAAALDLAGPRAGDGRYRVLHNSVAIDRVDGWSRQSARQRWGLPEDCLVFAYVGRASPEKNRPFAVDVHRAASERRSNVKLLAVGPGGIDDFTAAHPAIGEDPSVLLRGEVEEIASVLGSADVLLLPSRREGLPGVVLEALSVGVPVVATDLPCLRELVGQVRGLTLLPLAAGTGRWADAALAAGQTSAEQRQAIRESLRSSPFLTDIAAQEWRRLWGAGAR